MASTATGAPASATKAGFPLVFAVLAAGVVMSNLDVFIVNVALPDIGAHFDGASLASLSWILNGYAVVFGAGLVPAGRLADRTSPRNAYLLGVTVFTLASVLCALAPSVWTLIAARLLQAVGAATLLPASLGLLLAAAPPERRVPAVRLWSAISGLAAALGPVVGGLLTQLDWRWVFLINVPIGIGAVLVGLRALPNAAPRPAADRLDLTGAALLTLGVAVLSVGVVRSSDWGWTSGRTLGSLAAALVLLAWLAYRSARHPSPILPLPLLRIPAVGSSTSANFLFAVAFAAMLLAAVLWCQQVWHWTPLRTGLAIAPGPLMVPVLAVALGPVARRIGAGRVAMGGCVFFLAGLLWWTARLSVEPAYLTTMLPGILLTGVGVGLTLPTLISAAVAPLPPQSFSTGSAVVTMARQLGSVLGVAMLVAVLGGARQLSAAADFDRAWLMIAAVTVLAGGSCLLIPHRGD
jgi:EmrB/QacA subfamily drug resistance transporter